MQAANPHTSLRERLATQPPLMWISLVFLAGIVLGSLVSLSIWVWLGLALVFVVIAILSRILNLSSLRRSSGQAFSFLLQPFFFILLIALVLGAARYQSAIPKFDAFHIAFYNDRDYDLLITGTLIEPPDYRDTYTNLRVNVQKVDTGDSELPVHG